MSAAANLACFHSWFAGLEAARLQPLLLHPAAACACRQHTKWRQHGTHAAWLHLSGSGPAGTAPASGLCRQDRHCSQVCNGGFSRGFPPLAGTWYSLSVPAVASPPGACCRRRFFAALATEPPGVRAAVQEATASLASAFRCAVPTAFFKHANSPLAIRLSQPWVPARSLCRDAKGETAAALQQLLLESVGQQQPEAVRMAALQVRRPQLLVANRRRRWSRQGGFRPHRCPLTLSHAAAAPSPTRYAAVGHQAVPIRPHPCTLPVHPRGSRPSLPDCRGSGRGPAPSQVC